MAARPRCAWLLLGALLAGALGACEVSREEDLKALAGTKRCVLTKDIALSGPITPIDFRGELDGQGHWIKNIEFDFRKIYGEDTGSSKSIDASLFTNPKSLTNLGLEFKVDFPNEIGKIGILYLGAVGLSTGLTVRDVTVNGSLSARSGSKSIERAYIGGIAGYSTDKTSTLGPNVTSYCNLECKAGTCYVGGLAGMWSGKITGVAAILDSIKVEADYASAGGIVGWSKSASISESFADVGEITAAVGGGSHVGGFVGFYWGAEVRDSYASVSRINVTSSGSSTAGIRVSPFMGSFSPDGTASIARCYSWLDNGISVDASGVPVNMGGLVGYSSSSSLSISASFSYISNAEIAGSGDLELGGLCGWMVVSSGATNPSLDIHNVWTVINITSIAATSSVSAGGLCGYSKFDQSNAKLTNLEVTLYMNPSVAGTPATKSIGALAGRLNGTISGVLLRAECLGSKCAPVPLVASGTTTLFGVYAIDNGWEVTKGAATGEVAEVDPGTYDKASYEGLSPSDWVFYKSHYPTLSRLPVYGLSEGRDLSNPERSTWLAETWAVPEAQRNAPQLAKNKKCKGVGGNVLCVECGAGPSGGCTQCERDAEILEGGALCMSCLEGCRICDESRECQECGEATPFLDMLSEDPGKACLDAPGCAEAGGIADDKDSEKKQCRAARDLCGGEAEPEIEDCASCPEVSEGEPACKECKAGFLVDKRAGSATLGKCIARAECAGTSEPAGATCVRSPCAGIAKCTECKKDEPTLCQACQKDHTPSPDGKECLSLAACREGAGAVKDCKACDGEDPRVCAECAEGFLLDQRGEGQRGQAQCMKAEDCKDLAEPGAGEDKGKCLALACAKMDGCTRCDAADPKREKCAACKAPYGLLGGECRNDCLAGEGLVEHCGECSAEDGAVCGACAKGYELAAAEKEGEAAGTAPACRKAGLSAGAIAGIAVAAVAVAGLVVGLCVYFLVCRRRKAGSVA